MKAIEEKLDYTFRDQELLVNALTHSSYANENRGHSCESNERLEFLGDSVLGFVVADALYRRESELPEGRMTRVRAQLVCEDSLRRVAAELGLGEDVVARLREVARSMREFYDEATRPSDES